MTDWFDAEERVERAHELFELGRWEDAERELREAIAHDPSQAEWHFNLGLTLDAAGRAFEAAASFEQAFKLREEDGERDPAAAMMVGASLTRAQRWRDALGWLEIAAELDSTAIEPLVFRVECLTALGLHEDAELAFYLGQQIDPDRADLYAAMADSLLDRRLFDRAVWCLREAARLDPELPRVCSRLAEAYAETGRLERARQLYLAELRQDPGDLDILLSLAGLLADLHRPEEAAEKYRRVLELDPENAEAHFELGVLAFDAGDEATALGEFDIVSRLDPLYPGNRRRLAEMLLRRNRGDDAAHARRLLLEELRHARKPGESGVESDDLIELAELLLDARRPDQAAPVLRRARDADPKNARVIHLLSVASLERGRFAEGIELAREALALRPDNVAAMHNLALAYLRDGRWLRSGYWIRQARRFEPDDAGLRQLRLRLRWRATLEVGRWVLRVFRNAVLRPTRA
ncbi:MAG: tetratricopeptide repeat protein [Planctomycetota bacterium]